jgi:hypothetical protein
MLSPNLHTTLDGEKAFIMVFMQMGRDSDTGPGPRAIQEECKLPTGRISIYRQSESIISCKDGVGM